ncbi:unnamed protein product [Closterium sp. Naga37s-1]|nr:unnamed protein product [Closterium sp. Naga37s-1]
MGQSTFSLSPSSQVPPSPSSQVPPSPSSQVPPSPSSQVPPSPSSQVPLSPSSKVPPSLHSHLLSFSLLVSPHLTLSHLLPPPTHPSFSPLRAALLPTVSLPRVHDASLGLPGTRAVQRVQRVEEAEVIFLPYWSTLALPLTLSPLRALLPSTMPLPMAVASPPPRQAHRQCSACSEWRRQKSSSCRTGPRSPCPPLLPSCPWHLPPPPIARHTGSAARAAGGGRGSHLPALLVHARLAPHSLSPPCSPALHGVPSNGCGIPPSPPGTAAVQRVQRVEEAEVVFLPYWSTLAFRTNASEILDPIIARFARRHAATATTAASIPANTTHDSSGSSESSSSIGSRGRGSGGGRVPPLVVPCVYPLAMWDEMHVVMWDVSVLHVVMWDVSVLHVVMWDVSVLHVVMWDVSVLHVVMWDVSVLHVVMWDVSVLHVVMWDVSVLHVVMWDVSVLHVVMWDVSVLHVVMWDVSVLHVVMWDVSVLHVVMWDVSVLHVVMWDVSVLHVVMWDVSVLHVVMWDVSVLHVVMWDVSVLHVVMWDVSVLHVVMWDVSVLHVVMLGCVCAACGDVGCVCAACGDVGCVCAACGDVGCVCAACGDVGCVCAACGDVGCVCAACGDVGCVCAACGDVGCVCAACGDVGCVCAACGDVGCVCAACGDVGCVCAACGDVGCVCAACGDVGCVCAACGDVGCVCAACGDVGCVCAACGDVGCVCAACGDVGCVCAACGDVGCVCAACGDVGCVCAACGDVGCVCAACGDVGCVCAACGDVGCVCAACGDVGCVCAACGDVGCVCAACGDVGCVCAACGDVGCVCAACGDVGCVCAACGDVGCGGIIRQQVQRELQGQPGVQFTVGRAENSSMTAQAGTSMRRAKYCLVPRGDTSSSCRLFDAMLSGCRLFDAMLSGCIPVIISDALDPPFEDAIDYSAFSLLLPAPPSPSPCLPLTGDTSSSCRLFDAILSGCIPVIISDALDPPFEDTIDYSAFSHPLPPPPAVSPSLPLAGDTSSSCRLFDAMLSGCIPLIISDALDPPFEDVIDYSTFSLLLPAALAVRPGYILGVLHAQTEAVWRQQWEAMRKVAHHFIYSFPPRPGGAVWRGEGSSSLNTLLCLMPSLCHPAPPHIPASQVAHHFIYSFPPRPGGAVWRGGASLHLLLPATTWRSSVAGWRITSSTPSRHDLEEQCGGVAHHFIYSFPPRPGGAEDMAWRAVARRVRGQFSSRYRNRRGRILLAQLAQAGLNASHLQQPLPNRPPVAFNVR